ncbi:YeeE/YedE thiosulfate transporter family protein [Rubellimicrobium thermophilum]
MEASEEEEELSVTAFTPWASLAGGLMIGAAAVLLMALHGRILGATGILGGVLRFDDAAAWRLRAALLAGMIAAPSLLWLLTGRGPEIEVPVSAAALVAGGLLVGIGTAYGSGCTSGHGVCGLARLSRRSILATLSFMAGAFVTVFVTRHLIGV